MPRTYSLADLGALAQRLASAGVIAYPTEAVFGLGCDPFSDAAVERLYKIKRRDPAQGFLLIAADEQQLQPFVDWSRLTPLQCATVRATWPGPATWVLQRAPGSPSAVTGIHDGIAVRITAHAPAAALCRAFGGALVSTSANLHGAPPARSAAEVERQFPGAELDGILDAPLGRLDQPTQIRDALTGRTIR